MLKALLTGTLLPEISREFLARMAAGKPVIRVHVTANGDGKFVYQLE